MSDAPDAPDAPEKEIEAEIGRRCDAIAMPLDCAVSRFAPNGRKHVTLAIGGFKEEGESYPDARAPDMASAADMFVDAFRSYVGIAPAVYWRQRPRLVFCDNGWQVRSRFSIADEVTA